VQHNTEPWQARPVKRVYIPKRGSTGKRRPLGIPVIVDRCLQVDFRSLDVWSGRVGERVE